MNPMAERFGMALAQLRTSVDLSQSRLAARAGYDHSYISRLESGTRFPTRNAIERLADAMRLDQMDRDGLLEAAGFLSDSLEALRLRDAHPIVQMLQHRIQAATESEQERIVRIVETTLTMLDIATDFTPAPIVPQQTGRMAPSFGSYHDD